MARDWQSTGDRAQDKHRARSCSRRLDPGFAELRPEDFLQQL